MYIDYSSWETFEYSISSLQLDLNNPRIKYGGETLNQTQIMKFLISKEKIYDLAKKISEEGYFVGEEPIICIEKNKKVVLEGNRRTAALKLLQDPKKYLSSAKANILLQNISKNNFPVDKKLKCHIAPNRLLANPIIYERHNGDSLKKWKTGNQYAFVAEMYYDSGLSIDHICDVLNENRAHILKPLKAYNLFYEGKVILEKEENITIDISEFDFTNLERFYSYEPARKFLGIEFNNENGELLIKIPHEEYEKRLLEVFKIIIDAERFSRDFNKDDDKEKFIQKLTENSLFDFSVLEQNSRGSKTSQKKTDLEVEKSKITTRRQRKSKSKIFENRIIAANNEIIFDNDKLDSLFSELKSLPTDKKYSFAVLLRTYLEQAIYFYLKEKKLFDNLSSKTSQEAERNSKKKVDSLILYLKRKHKINDEIDSEEIMSILKFKGAKDYSNASLKTMLDYVKNNELDEHLDTNQLRNLKDYLDRIKDGLDLAVHNIERFVDIEHNRTAWRHLEPLFGVLSNNLTIEN